MASGLDQITLTRAAREVLDLAEDCWLSPRVGQGGPGDHGRGQTSVRAGSGMRSGLFGSVIVRPGGRIVRAFLLHGNHSAERRYEGTAAVRTVIASWAAIIRPVWRREAGPAAARPGGNP
jgi:hypothetical protein